MSLPISKAQIKHIIGKNISTFGNNTLFLIEFYETVCQSRKIEVCWENIKKIMLEDYLPESVMRKRREFVESSDEQRDKEVEYHETYSPSNPSKG